MPAAYLLRLLVVELRPRRDDRLVGKAFRDELGAAVPGAGLSPLTFRRVRGEGHAADHAFLLDGVELVVQLAVALRAKPLDLEGLRIVGMMALGFFGAAFFAGQRLERSSLHGSVYCLAGRHLLFSCKLVHGGSPWHEKRRLMAGVVVIVLSSGGVVAATR